MAIAHSEYSDGVNRAARCLADAVLSPVGGLAESGNDRIVRRERLVELHTAPAGNCPGDLSLQPLSRQQFHSDVVCDGNAEASIQLQAAEGKIDNARGLEAPMAVDQCCNADSTALGASPKRLARLIWSVGRIVHCVCSVR
jgi:hypothetical protein